MIDRTKMFGTDNFFIFTKEMYKMARSNKTLVPEAREALDRFKMEAAEVGVNLKNGYNGDITSRQAGSVGGQMVKKMTPVRNLFYSRENRIVAGHRLKIKYCCNIIA